MADVKTPTGGAVLVTVAPGRSVTQAVPNTEKYSEFKIGNGITEKRVVSVEQTVFGPGKKLTVTAKEAAWLFKIKHILDPNPAPAEPDAE